MQRLSVPADVRGTFLHASIAGFAGFAVLGLFTAVAPTFLSDVIGVGNHAVAGLVVFAVFAASAVAQIGLRTLPVTVAFNVGCTLLIVGMGLVAIALWQHSLTALVVGGIVASTGQGMTFSKGVAAITAKLHPDDKAEVTSTFFVVVYVAISLPVIGVDVAAEAWGLTTAGLIFTIAVAALSIVALVALVRQDRTPDLARNMCPPNWVTPVMAKVVVVEAFGGPEVLTVIDRDPGSPGPGEVLVDMRAIGVNPVDYKMYGGAFGRDATTLPLRVGFEGSGVVRAVGDDATGPAGPVSVGDEVIVYPAQGTYAEQIVVPADAVVPKPSNLPWEQAAGLLLTATTAADEVATVRVGAGDTVLIHGAAGAVGLFAVQLAVAAGAGVIGTAREANHDYLRSLGAEPVVYGDGLADRVRALAPDGIDAAIDTVGTDEAVDVSLELVSDRDRIVTIVAFERSQRDGFRFVGSTPASTEFRNRARLELIERAGAGQLEVVVAKTFPLIDAALAHTELQRPHDRGTFVLIP